MKALCDSSRGALGVEEGAAHFGQAAASDRGAYEPAARPESVPQHERSDTRLRSVIQDSDGYDDIGASRFEQFQRKAGEGFSVSDLPRLCTFRR